VNVGSNDFVAMVKKYAADGKAGSASITTSAAKMHMAWIPKVSLYSVVERHDRTHLLALAAHISSIPTSFTKTAK